VRVSRRYCNGYYRYVEGREHIAVFNGCFRWYVKPDMADCARPYAPGTRGGKWRLYPKPTKRAANTNVAADATYKFDSDLFDFVGSIFWAFSFGYRPTREEICKLRTGYELAPLKRHSPMSFEVWDSMDRGHKISADYFPFPEIIGWAPQVTNPKVISLTDHAEEQLLVGFVNASLGLWTLSQGVSQAACLKQRGPKYAGEFVYCPSCEKWDVSGTQRTKCNLCGSDIEYISSDRVRGVLCGSTIEYVLSDRWRCKGTYIADQGFPTRCYGRGRSPSVAGDECAFAGCGRSTLKAAKAVKITLGYHKLTQISETEYKEEICFVGDAPHTEGHVQKLDRDRLAVRRGLTRGSVGSWRCRVRQAVDVAEPLINPLTEMPEKDPISCKVVVEEYDLKCEECGSIVRYNELYEKECSGCGLLASNSAYLSMENYFNANIADEPEARGDRDWELQELMLGSERERAEYIQDWRAIRRKGDERADLNKVQHGSWRKEQQDAAKRIPKEHRAHKYIPRDEEQLRTDFIDYRLWTLLNMDGGRIEQADISVLFESKFNGVIITARQAEESVKRAAKLGRIRVEAVYGTPKGKRIVINRLPISHSIANT
jgi:hypothetical protein